MQVYKNALLTLTSRVSIVKKKAMAGSSRSFTTLSRKLADLALAMASGGCGLIFGGEQKVDTKSRDYQILRLDR